AQVTNDAGSQRALPNAVVRIRRDQDGWNDLSRSRQVAMQIEPGHPGHLHVGDQAGGAADMGRAQKLFCGRSGLDPISQRLQETLDRSRIDSSSSTIKIRGFALGMRTPAPGL